MIPAGTLSLSSCFGLPRGNREIARRRVGEARGRIRGHLKERLGALRQHQKADRAREPCGAMIFSSQANCDTDPEQQPKVRENRVSGRGDKRHVEEVGLAQAEQHSRDREDRDRKHQRSAERLELVEFEAESFHVSESRRIQKLGCESAHLTRGFEREGAVRERTAIR